jgi:uncharacterized protein (DUF362 family)
VALAMRLSIAKLGDPIVEETREDLAMLQAAHPSEPIAQIRAITLLGLEREQLVAIAYRDAVLRTRLETLPLPDDARDAIRHAMRWIWKEEEMHATFVRGVLLRGGTGLARLRAYVVQAMGAVAGWASSVLHHARWRDAPLSRFWAHVFTFGGWLGGRVPRSVTRSLRHLSFRAYCRFSVSAEATAAMCWHRVAALLRESGAPGAAGHYAQMGTDEDHHGAIFGLLAEAIDDTGALAEGWSAARLRERLLAIGPFYVAREQRPDAAASPLGAGGDVHVERGGPAEGPATLRRLLAQLDLDAILRERAAARGVETSALRVAIKPTFMRAYHRDDRTVHTSPALVAALVEALSERGITDVTVLEGKAIYDWFFESREVKDVAAYIGMNVPGARVLDVEHDLAPHAFRRGMAQSSVCASWRDADVRISFGKLSTHPVDHVYLGLAQLESLNAAADDHVFVERQTQRGPATMALLGELPPHLALLDAFEDVPHGLGGIIACDRPLAPRRLYGGRDAIAVDLVASRHVGELHPEVSPHLDAALHWFGDPRPHVRVLGDDTPIANWRGTTEHELDAMLTLLAHPMYVLASGRGRLFLPEMDEEAFPPKAPTPAWLRAAQAAVRVLLRTRRPRPRG